MITVVVIRHAQSDDAMKIAEIHVRSWQSGYADQLPRLFLEALDTTQRSHRWRDTLAEQAGAKDLTLVAEDADTLLGFVHLRPTRDVDQDPGTIGEITSLYVSPDRWRTGIGRDLIAAALDHLRGAGCAAATLWVLSTNLRAISFYTASGWEPDGAAKNVEIACTSRCEIRYRRRL